MFIPTRNRAALGSCALLFTFLGSRGIRAAETAPDFDADPAESVVVTATRSARAINEVPESVSVVGAQAIADTPGQALDDILRRSASVDLPNATSYQLHPTANNISMRGLGGIRALVLLDGVPMNDPFFGYLQWSRVPLELVKQVEIVRGGGATLWGNYAMGGVINIRTRDPETDELAAEFSGGSFGTYRANAFGSYLLSDSARVAVSAGRNHTDGFMQIGPDVRGPVDVPTAFTSNNAAFRASTDLTSSLKATARVDYFDNDQTLQTRLSHNAQHTWNYAGSLQQQFLQSADLTLTAFGSDSTFTTDNTGGFAGIPENQAEFLENVHRTPVKDVGISLAWSHPLNWGWLRSYSFGTDYHRIAGEDVSDIFDETGTRVRTDIGRGKQRFWGGFAQTSIKPLDALEILASVRFQSFHNFAAFDGTPGGLGNAPDSSESSVDPRVSVRYSLTSVFALRAAYYSAFRAPTLDNLYRAFSVPFGIFYANPELVRESLKGGEVGFDIHTARLRTQVTAYTNSIDNLITSRTLQFNELPPGFFFGTRNINAGKARSRGLELETQVDVATGWTASVAYNFADSRITANALDPASVDKQIADVPQNRASVSVTYQSPWGLRLTPQFRWLQSSYGDNDHTLAVDAQHIVDLSAAYSISKNAEVFLHFENLFNERYIANNSGFNPPLRGTPFTAIAGAKVRL
ncbi:MAG: TonB-dependent receptor [Proteobacteria bacterium]|nr:TonB-dependent receptor [Pseudomonadota bacterium]